MKGIILALLSFIFFFLIAILLLRRRQWKKHFKALLIAFPLGAVFYLWGYSFTPDSLYFLPGAWVEPSSSVDCLNGLLVLFLLFLFFWDVLYEAAITGFSAGLMVKLEQSMPDGMTLEQLTKRYLKEDGTDIVFARRVTKLTEGGYIQREREGFSLTAKGKVLALKALVLKKLLNAGEGG